MNKETLFDKLRDLIGSLGWKMFLWASEMTEEEYWERLYEHEKMLHEHPEMVAPKKEPEYVPQKPIIRRGRPSGKYGKQIKREGGFGIQAGKIVTKLRFKTLEEAQTWGEWNYRGKENWKVIEINSNEE